MVLASINQGENERKEETKEWMRLPASPNDHRHQKNTESREKAHVTARVDLKSHLDLIGRCVRVHLHSLKRNQNGENFMQPI